MRNGKTPFETSNSSKNNPNSNPNLPRAINELGGMEKVARSTVGRNMWLIMKMFNALPNDPLIKSLTYAQREFIVASITQDNREAELGDNTKEVSHVVDNSDYKDKFYSNDNIDLLEDGDNLDDIYNQVQKLTNDPRFEMDIDNKIEHALEDKKSENKNADQIIKESWDKIEQDAKQAISDEEWAEI